MKKIGQLILIASLLMIGTEAFSREAVVLGWDGCVREALKNNPDLAAAHQQIKQRKAEKWVATSPMLPQISTGASYSKSDTFSGVDDRSSNTYFARGQQLLFDGLKTYNEFKSAKQNLIASEHSYTAASTEIRYNLRTAFAELLKAQELVPITKGILDRRRQNLRLIKLRYESGREHEGALLFAEADVSQAQYDYSKAMRDTSVGQYALRKVLGWEEDIPIRIKGSFKLMQQIDSKPDLRVLADNHPLIKSISAQKRSAQYELKSAKGEFFPNFDASAEVGKVRGSGFSSSNGWMVGLNATLPIFEGGRRIANTTRAKAKLIEVRSNEISEYDGVLSNLEAAWQNLKDAVEANSVQKKYLEANSVRAKIATAQYANGLLIFDNWIIIEDNYIRSQKAYVSAEADMLIAEAEWNRAKGEALEYE